MNMTMDAMQNALRLKFADFCVPVEVKESVKEGRQPYVWVTAVHPCGKVCNTYACLFLSPDEVYREFCNHFKSAAA
jgi:hypothetical protein